MTSIRPGPPIVAGLARRSAFPLRVVRRNAKLARHYWAFYVGRLLEPFLYLSSIGIGVGVLVDEVVGPTGEPIPYRLFVAPAMLATSAMNVAMFASANEFYAKFKWVRSYASMLATPIGVGDIIRGELLWILVTVSIQSTAFVATMVALGLVSSWWGVLLLPAALLVAFAFAGAGFVAASFLRSWLDFDYISLAIVPMFLFSASFFPIERYPEPVAVIVRLTPLFHGVDLARDLSLGTVDGWSLVSVAYLVGMGLGALAVADRRLSRMLRP